MTDPKPPGDAKPASKPEAEQAGILVWGKLAANASVAIAPFLIVRILGTADVGAFATLNLIYETVLVLLIAGLPRAALYFLPDRSLADRRATVTRMVRLMVGLGAAAGILLALIGLLAEDALRVTGEWVVAVVGGERSPSTTADVDPQYAFLPLLGLFALADVPTRLLPNVLLVEGRPKGSAGVGIIRSIGIVCAQLIPAALGYGVGGIMAGHVVFGVLYAGFFFAVLGKLYRAVPLAERPLAQRSIPTMSVLVRYAVSLGISEVVSKLNYNLDLWLIVIFFSVEEVAQYKNGAWQIPLVTTVVYSVGEVYLGRFKILFQTGEARAAIHLWRESITKVSLLVVPAAAVFVVAAEEFVTLAFTEEYLAAAPVFRCYCLLTAMRVAAFGNVMISAGRPDYVLRAAGFTFASNLVISVPLVLTVGFLGPAIGTVIAFVPTIFYYCWFIAKAAKVDVRETFPLLAYLRVVLVCLPVAGLAWWFKLAVSWHPAVMLGVEAAIVLVGFALVATVLGLITRADWRFVADWARLKQMK